MSAPTLDNHNDDFAAATLDELQVLLGEKDGVIGALEEKCEALRQERSALLEREQERAEQVVSLESQKMALEAKVGYMQRQVQELEALRSRVRELTLATSSEAEGTKEQLERSRQKVGLLEAELARTKRELEASKVELALIKRETSQTNSQLLVENTRLETVLAQTQNLLKDERTRHDTLEERLGERDVECRQLQDALAGKEAELVRQRRAMSSDLSLHRSLLPRRDGRPREEQTPPVLEEEDQQLSMTSLSEECVAPMRRSINGTDHLATTANGHGQHEGGSAAAIKAIRAECERLALENNHLRTVSQNEYLRNIVLRFLQLPEQRPALLPVLASLLRLSESELASVRK